MIYLLKSLVQMEKYLWNVLEIFHMSFLSYVRTYIVVDVPTVLLLEFWDLWKDKFLVGLSTSWTFIIRVVGEHYDHLTNTTPSQTGFAY